MAKNNKADMSCARVKKYTASDVSKAERHNERKNETYENMNVIAERIPFNVHFKKPTAPTYMEQLKQMETDGQVSLRGLRKDATLFDEIVIDVNTMYFERNGGYEYAKLFYEEAYHFIEEKFGADNVISAVMHADEINVAATEELGKEVYHYHLHAMVLPVVEKEILWSKRCKDEKLKSKIRDQISYLEKDLISMLNGFNNISYSNYKIEKRHGAQSSQTNTLIEENKKQGSTNGESLQETKRNNDSVEKSSNESESDNMNDNNSNASNQGNSSIIMVPNSILLSDINQKIDWNNMKYEIEKIYSTWNSLFIDLNSLEKGNTKTLEFSSTLNDTTKSIKAENKIASMQNIAEMYIKLGDYSKSYTNDNLQINIIDTKKNIIQAYVYVTENNWDMALNSINKADESFGNVINNVSAQPANQSNINKAYVLLKEEKKAIDLKDQDIFFINYKMIMQELYDI